MTKTQPIIFSDQQNGDGNHHVWSAGTILIFAVIPSLPLLLIFTIKQKKKKNIHTQPPNKLQFHDVSVTSQGISHPLQFHENFEDLTEDISVINQPVIKDVCKVNVIDHTSTEMVVEDLENHM